MGWEALLVVYSIVAVRLLLPLAIPRWPLFGILVCMVLDSSDLGLMQLFGFDPPWYQGYDKALDVYYLAIAYLATIRNWENTTAVQVGRVLFYYRVVGVLVFELTGVRQLLAVFPNAFEAFFVYFELIRRRGDPMLLTRNAMLVVVAVIWFVLKLPHEWWVHIAQLDATDFIKAKILGASLDTSFWRAIVEAPVVVGTIMVIVAVLTLAVRRWVRSYRRRLAAGGESRLAARWAHWRRPVVGAEASGPVDILKQARRRMRVAMYRGRSAATVRPKVLMEKIVLVALVLVVFQQILPGLQANGVRTALFVAVAIVATDFIVRWVMRRFGVPFLPRVNLVGTAVLNFLFVLLFQYIIPFIRPGSGVRSVLVFASLITLFVTLYDHYRPIYDVRESDACRSNGDSEAGSSRGVDRSVFPLPDSEQGG